MNQIKEFEIRNIFLFILITYSWSWLFWLPAVLSPTGHSDPLPYILYIIGAFGPFVGAFSLTFINERMKGVKELWMRFLNLKLELKWLFISILLFPVLYVISYLIALPIQGIAIPLVWISQPWLIINYFMTSLILGGLSEEFGWRGFILDRFQEKWNAVISSLILGVIWSFWHLPMWFIPGDSHAKTEILGFFFFTLDLLFLSITISWLYNNTNRNILIAVIVHTVYNFMTFIIILTNISGPIFKVLFYITVILIVIFFKVKKLVRNPK